MDGGRFPQVLQGVLGPLRNRVSSPQFAHLRMFILAMLISSRKAKLSHIAAAAPRGGHRTSCGAFLRAEWDAPTLLEAQALRTLQRMKPQAGEALYLIIDDTRIEKRGRKMEAVAKIYDHKTQRFVRGHIAVTACLTFRGVTIPWRIDLWLPKEYAGGAYRKINQIAADLIGRLSAPAGLKVRVLFDAFYLAPNVVRACESRGFTWFSVASKNRKLVRKNCRTRSINEFAPGVLKHQGRRVRLRRARGWRWLRIASVDGRLSKLGEVRMVLSKRPRDPWKKTLAIVTNERRLKPREIVSIYEKRWNIEVLFKELRVTLGLGDYQVLSRSAIERHLHLCCLAHLTLTHHGLQAEGAQAKQQDKEVALPPMQQRLDNLRASIHRDRTKSLLKRIHNRRIRKAVNEFLSEFHLAA
jgi:SRSO17 transposase